MTAKTTRRWPAAVAVVAGGLFLGAGGFGLFRVAHAEPVPAAPPQFRPATSELLPGATPPAAIQNRPGDVLPVPALPADPRPADPAPIPVKASDLPKVPPIPVELLPPPTAEVKRESAPPPVPVVKLPSSAAPVPALPLPALETPKSSQPAKSAESPRASLPPLPELNLRPAEPRNTVKPGEPLPAPPVIEFPATPAVELNKPAPVATPTGRTTAPVETPLGETPMTTVRQATRAAVLGTALLAFPLFADAQDPKPTDPVKYADLDPIKEQVRQLRADVNALKLMEKQLKDIRDALEGKSDSGSATDGLLKSVQRMQTTLDGLDRKLQNLENKLSDTSRTSLASPIAGGIAIPIAGRSVVKLVNEYPVEVSMLLNGVPHRVPPGMTKEVPVAAGGFKYQLLTSGAREVDSPIKDGETVTLRVR